MAEKRSEGRASREPPRPVLGARAPSVGLRAAACGAGAVGLLLASVVVLAALLDACKPERVASPDARVISPDAGGRNCDAEPNEWRVTDPGPAAVLDDAGTRINLMSIWGVPDNTQTPPEPVGAIYAAGSRGRVLVYDGEQWTVQETGTEEQLTSVWGASPNDVWVAGYHGTVYHYDGQAWTDQSPPTSLFVTTDGGVPTGDAATDIRRNLWGIWVAAQNAGGPQPTTSAVYVVGDRGTVLHNKNNVWSVVPSGVEEKLTGVWGTAEDNVFIVGDFGTVLQGGTTLSKAQTGVDSALRGVWGRGGNDVYAVGVDGAVLHFDGGAWTLVEGAPKQVLRSVWGPPNDSSFVYIVGWDGALIKLTGGPGFGEGGNFFPFNCVTMHRLESIWGTLVEVPDIPDGGLPDSGVDAGMKTVSAVWVSGVSGMIITGP